MHPHDAVRRVSEHSITVMDICQDNLWGPKPDDRAEDVLAHMCSHGYDIAPIIEWRIRRYVARDDLSVSSPELVVANVSRTISADDLVSASMPLADAIDTLSQRPWAFVLGDREVDGLITIADLQGITVNLVVFGFILAAEAGIDALARPYDYEGLAGLLSSKRRGRIDEVFVDRKSRNADIDYLACLNVEDRLKILEKSPELRAAVGMSSSHVREIGEVLKRLRDTLAHGGSILDLCGDAQAGISAALKAREFADRVWIAVSNVTG